MKSELELRIEMTRMLYDYCYMVRRGKKRVDIVPAAHQREMQFKRELEELEAERDRTQTPQLPLAHHHHEEAA